MSSIEPKIVDDDDKKAAGELLFCGATCWDLVGRKKTTQDGNLVSPTRLRPLIDINICFVTSGCASCHCLALDTEGRCYTWGRNEKGQLGHGDRIQRDRPTAVSELAKYKIIKAGTGRGHTVVVTDKGQSLAFGWNKHGQLGSGSSKNEVELFPVRCQVADVKNTACGAEFTVWLSSVEGSSIITAGLPQYGQLGHGTDNEYNTKDSSVKLAYEPQPRPRAIATFSGETVVKVACGTNHTVAVDSNGYVYTWGFGGYGRLGHREQKDEWSPRRVDVFQRNNILPPNAVVSAGSVNSACTAGGGQLYMWGKIKNTGDDWMYPKPLMDLSGWNLRCMDSGNMHHFVGADSSCISWGHALYGELGYGPTGQKSSAIPKKVEMLEGIHVIGVACGMGHSLVIVDRSGIKDRLDQLDIFDGKAAGEANLESESKATVSKQSSPAAKTSDVSKKRKKAKNASETEEDEDEEDEEVSDVESDDETDSPINGKAKRNTSQRKISSGRGGGRGRGRGGGRPLGSKSADTAKVKTGGGRRGRPRKS